MPIPSERLDQVFADHLGAAQLSRDTLLPLVEELAEDLCRALGNGGKLVVFGNGGSAADAQHFAAELTGHFQADRGPLPAVALTVDTSALTAIANDFGYDDVFARQATALCSAHDVAVGLSTSGNARSVIRGVEAARAAGARTWALTGGSGGALRTAADRAIVVPSSETARIQEIHITIIHAVCAVVDDWALARG
jgi:D-sedoheptulose 7-phosphate isomerase